MIKKLFVVLTSTIIATMLLSTCANRTPKVTPTSTPGVTITSTLIGANTPALTSTDVPTLAPTFTLPPTQTAIPIPLASAEKIKKSFDREINPLVKQLLAAKDDPDAGLTPEYRIIYVPQTERLYYVQSILQLNHIPDSGTGKKAYVLYNYSRGRTLGYRQTFSIDVSSETQEIKTAIRLVIEENGKFHLVETLETTGGSGSASLINLVENAVPPLDKLSSSNPHVETDLEGIIGYACGIDMTPALDYQRKMALFTFALSGANWAEPYQGAIELAALDPAPLDSVPALISLLDYNSDKVQSAAESALSKMAESPQAFDLLAAAVRNPNPGIRKKLAWVFANIKSKPHAALAPLISLFYDRDSSVPGYAASALGSFGDPAAIPLMNKALKDKDPDTRRLAASVLHSFGPQAVMAVPNLIALLKDKDVQVRAEAARALSEIDSQEKSSLPALIQAAKVETEGAFILEINAIASLSSEADTLDLLKGGLTHTDVGVRMTICTTLRYYKDIPAASKILILALSDPNAHVRQEAVNALKAMTGQDFGEDIQKWREWVKAH